MTQNDQQKIYKTIKNELLDPIPESTAPQAVLIIGEPGAGKTTLMRPHAVSFFTDQIKAPFVDIDYDNLRRHHPDVQKIADTSPEDVSAKTAPLTRQLFSKLTQDTLKSRKNVLIDAPVVSPDETMTLMRRLKMAGYSLHLYAMPTNQEYSFARSAKRYEKTLANRLTASGPEKYSHIPRAVSRTDHIRFYYDQLDLLNKAAADKSLIKSTNLYQRDHDGPICQGENTDQAIEIFQKERKKPLSDPDRKKLADTWKFIHKKRQDRGAPQADISDAAQACAKYDTPPHPRHPNGQSR